MGHINGWLENSINLRMGGEELALINFLAGSPLSQRERGCRRYFMNPLGSSYGAQFAKVFQRVGRPPWRCKRRV